MEEIRIVVVGDEKSGKSTLINRFIKDSLPARGSDWIVIVVIVAGPSLAVDQQAAGGE